MKFLAMLALAACLNAEPRIVYSKSFPGSVPPFVIITLERDGKGVYRESEEDPQPVKFQIKAEEAADIYALAERLEHFSKPLESGLNVARMGLKSFRWDDGSAKQNKVEFNYSLDENARLINEWFEKMSESAQHYIALERAVKFDKLGTNKALLQMQAALERKRIIATDQFLPLLDRVIRNSGYLNMDRDRAAVLANWIRNPPPAPAAEEAKPGSPQP